MIDPRAKGQCKIEPPLPLPHVSRKSLMRVTDAMPPPDHCPNCGCDVLLVNNREIYGREYGDWPYAYRCVDHRGCDSYVGLHPNTDLPLGTLANKPTREARKTYKSFFFQLQRARGWSRKQAYAWLTQRMGIPPDQCHWGFFGVAQAELAGSICEEALESMSEETT